MGLASSFSFASDRMNSQNALHDYQSPFVKVSEGQNSQIEG
jgi:hypothetical protein